MFIGRQHYKMLILSKITYKVNVIQTKIPTDFCWIWQVDSKLYREEQRAKINQDKYEDKMGALALQSPSGYVKSSC